MNRCNVVRGDLLNAVRSADVPPDAVCDRRYKSDLNKSLPWLSNITIMLESVITDSTRNKNVYCAH